MGTFGGLRDTTNRKKAQPLGKLEEEAFSVHEPNPGGASVGFGN